MQLLIISDLHLGRKFDPVKLRYFLNLFDQVDKIVLAGDFWDPAFYSFGEFLFSAWRPLLAKLGTKDTVYLPGNHDHMGVIDERVFGFASEVSPFYVIEMNELKLIVAHGHQPPTKNQVPKASYRYLKFLEDTVILGSDWVWKVLLRSSWIRRNLQICNLVQKRWSRKLTDPNEYLILGHTHIQCLDHKSRHVNLGVNKYGLAEYLIVNTDDSSFELVSDFYEG